MAFVHNVDRILVLEFSYAISNVENCILYRLLSNVGSIHLSCRACRMSFAMLGSYPDCSISFDTVLIALITILKTVLGCSKFPFLVMAYILLVLRL